MKTVFALLVILSITAAGSAAKIVSGISLQASPVRIPGVRYVATSVDPAAISFKAIN
jgi:hypothetical protein